MEIGLVLSGGMAKGAYQIGALRAINEFIPKNEIKCISCASVGVLNGYAYATERLALAEKMWKNICNNNSRFFVSQMLKSSMLQQNIEVLYDKNTSISSSFYCSLLDVGNRSIVYKDLAAVEGDKIPVYLKASVAMPIYNRSVIAENIYYYDGAMIDNIPVFPLLKHKLDYIICIYFDDICYKFENDRFNNKIIKITFPCESGVKESLVFKRDNIEKMIDMGYVTAF